MVKLLLIFAASLDGLFNVAFMQSVHSWKIVKHFNEKCYNPIVPFKYLRFVIMDVLTNTESWSKDEIEDLFLRKKNLRVGH